MAGRFRPATDGGFLGRESLNGRRVRRADNLHQEKLRLVTDKFLDAFGIVNAGHLQQDLAGRFGAMPLQRRFLNAERIDATFDNFLAPDQQPGS